MQNDSDTKGLTGRSRNYPTIPIPGELEARNERGVTVAAGTIYDYNQEKFQQTINEDFEDRISDIEENGVSNGSPIYIIKANKDFEYGGTTYRLTSGYIEQKDVYEDDTLIRESGYTDDEYTTMYNNARAVEAAIKYAYENGYGGVKFERGEYCFSPERPTNRPSYCYPTIKICNLSHFDIDFGGSTFYNLVDSEYLPPYYHKADNSDPSYKTWSYLFFISNSEFVTIHDGTFIGDRAVRKWIETEHDIEQTYGVVVGGFSRFINIKNIEATSFMGDGIAWFLYYYDGTNFYTTETYSPASTIKAYRGKFQYRKLTGTEGAVIIEQETTNIENCAISEIIPLSSLYGDANAVGTYKKFKDERIFFLRRSGRPFIGDDKDGNNNNILTNVYPDIDVLTYNDEDDENPIRIVKAHYLQNFKLLPNETRIRLQFYHEDLLCEDLGYIAEYESDPTNFKGALFKETVDGTDIYYVEKGLTVTRGRSHNVIIENCYIHDNHRGGFTGCAYNLTIRNCKFVRSNPIPEDKTGEPIYYYWGNDKYRTTRYHIDIEDVPSWGINIENNVFASYGTTPEITTGSVLFPAGIGLTVRGNYFDGVGLSVSECGDAIITDNTLYSLGIGEDRYLADGTLRYKYSDVGSGSLHAKRRILLSNNIINDITLRPQYLRNTTLKSSGNIYNKAIFMYARNIGTNGAIVDDSELDVSFINDNIRLKYVPNGVYGYQLYHRIPLSLFTNCVFDVTAKPESSPATIYIVNINNGVCVIKNNTFRNLKLKLSEELASLCKGTVFIEDCEFINSYFIPTISPDTSVTLKNIKNLKFNGAIIPSKERVPESLDGYRLIFEDCTITNKLGFTLSTYKVNVTFKKCNLVYNKTNNALFSINHPSVVTDASTNPPTTGPMQYVSLPDVHLIDCDNIDEKSLRLWNNSSMAWNDGTPAIQYTGDFVYDEASKDLRNEPVVLTQDATISAKFNRYYDVSGSGNCTLTITLPLKDDITSKISYFVVHKAAGLDVSFSVLDVLNPPVPKYSDDISTLTTEDCEISVLWNGSAWFITVVKF